jgi:hypothetical protein
MKRQIALAYIAAIMAGVLGAVCLPAHWYLTRAPKITAMQTGASAHAALLADKR